MTERPQRACSGPPEASVQAYPAGPADREKKPRSRTAGAKSRRVVTVVLPAQTPQLTAGAARVLLRILLESHAELAKCQREERNAE